MNQTIKLHIVEMIARNFVRFDCIFMLVGHFLFITQNCAAIPLKIKGDSTTLIPINISVPSVLFIPGIGGSILADEATGLHVWIRFYEASYYFERYMWGIFDEVDQTLKPYPGQPKVSPLMTGHGLDGIRNLDPSVEWPIYDYLSYFDALIKYLQAQGWVPGFNMFGFPWDWRQSQCWAPTLSKLKDSVLEARRVSGRNITIISHSMGSLVVKCFMATYPDIFADAVDRWISIAAPFEGAGAKIFMEFLQGYNLGNIVIGSEDAKRLSLESPSVYELLPHQKFEWKQEPYISLTINGTRQIYGSGGTSGFLFDELFRKALANHTMTLPGGGEPLPEPFNDACWGLSLATRGRLMAAALPAGARFYNVYGVSQATPIGLEFPAITGWADLQTSRYISTMADGDGTVAAESARAHGLAAVAATREVAADHMAIMTHPDTLTFVLDALYGRL